MPTCQIPYFGEIEINPVKSNFSAKANIDGYEVNLDLNFEKETVDKQSINVLQNFLQNLDQVDKKNRKYYMEDYQKSGTAFDYIEFCFGELDNEELNELINISGDVENQKKQLLNVITLKRIGMYPDGGRYLGVFDYSLKINGEYFDYMLVVNTNDKGEVDHITWES